MEKKDVAERARWALELPLLLLVILYSKVFRTDFTDRDIWPKVSIARRFVDAQRYCAPEEVNHE